MGPLVQFVRSLLFHDCLYLLLHPCLWIQLGERELRVLVGMQESNATCSSRPHDRHTNRKADFALVVYGLFVSAGAGREDWRSLIVPGKPNRLTRSALLAFLSIQPHSPLREAALSTAPLPTPAVLTWALPCSHSAQLLLSSGG